MQRWCTTMAGNSEAFELWSGTEGVTKHSGSSRDGENTQRWIAQRWIASLGLGTMDGTEMSLRPRAFLVFSE
ncbi:unnamed protein product [Amoebophrya sp. A25]|nr:unnamed protein product [Amoebophrya sp. A25]|eukprot:GSA25T00013301001.1